VFGALKEELLEASSGLMKKFKRQCMTGCARNLRFFFFPPRGFQALVRHQNKCIECNGDIVEELYSCNSNIV